MCLINNEIYTSLKPSHGLLHNTNKILFGFDVGFSELESVSDIKNRLFFHEFFLVWIYDKFRVDQKVKKIKNNLGMSSHV
jgi:hypothetical protein